MNYEQTFDSTVAFLQAINQNPAAWHKSNTPSTRNGFCEHETWAEAESAMLQGWQKGVDAVKSRFAKLEKWVGEKVKRETYSPAVSGLFFDVGLVLSGEPECWLQTEETEEESKGSSIVTVSINASVSGAIDRHVITNRGAAVCALVLALEASGKSVRVLYGMGFKANMGDGNPPKGLLTVTLKEAGQPLDLDSMAFWLTNPDAFRRFAFRWIETTPLWVQVGSSYGYPDKDWTPKADVALPAILASQPWSEAETQAWLTETLASQGIKIE